MFGDKEWHFSSLQCPDNNIVPHIVLSWRECSIKKINIVIPNIWSALPACSMCSRGPSFQRNQDPLMIHCGLSWTMQPHNGLSEMHNNATKCCVFVFVYLCCVQQCNWVLWGEKVEQLFNSVLLCYLSRGHFDDALKTTCFKSSWRTWPTEYLFHQILK